MTPQNLSDLLLEIRKTTSISAPVEVVWETMLEQISNLMTDPSGKSMSMRIEPWPGGRYFRDLGNGTGHLWGHVQVIKPPKLLEISGPLFISAPAMNHVQYRITAAGEGAELTLLHRGFGLIDPEVKTGVHSGWQNLVDHIKAAAEKR